MKQYSIVITRETLELDRIWILDPSFTCFCDPKQIILCLFTDLKYGMKIMVGLFIGLLEKADEFIFQA